MKRRMWVWAVLVGVVPALAALILAGCGGSGGPIAPPPDEGPGVSKEFLALLPEGQKDATYIGGTPCRQCHETGVGGAPVVDFVKWEATKHADKGLGCEQCHGPGSAHKAAPTKTNILTYPNISRSIVCGQCHGPMMAEHEASPHGPMSEEIEEAVLEGRDPCQRCHTVPVMVEKIDHELSAGKTPDQIDAGITAMTADQRIASAAAAHEAVSCVNCHDPMAQTSNLTLAGKQGHLRRRTHTTDVASVEGAATPAKTVTTFDHTCARCHMAGTSRTPATDDASLNSGTSRVAFHYNPQYYMLMGRGGVEPTPPVQRNTAHFSSSEQCVKCHMPGSSHTMRVSFDKSCNPCHTPADAAARYAIRGDIELKLFVLRQRMENWARNTTFTGPNITGDPDMWDYTSYIADRGKTAPAQAQVPIQIKRARHNYYLVLKDGSFGIHNSSYTRYLLTVAGDQLTALGRSAAPLAPSQVSKTDMARIRAILDADRRRAKPGVDEM